MRGIPSFISTWLFACFFTVPFWKNGFFLVWDFDVHRFPVSTPMRSHLSRGTLRTHHPGIESRTFINLFNLTHGQDPFELFIIIFLYLQTLFLSGKMCLNPTVDSFIRFIILSIAVFLRYPAFSQLLHIFLIKRNKLCRSLVVQHQSFSRPLGHLLRIPSFTRHFSGILCRQRASGQQGKTYGHC